MKVSCTAALEVQLLFIFIHSLEAKGCLILYTDKPGNMFDVLASILVFIIACLHPLLSSSLGYCLAGVSLDGWFAVVNE